MSEVFDCATKAEELGRELKDLHALLVVIRESRGVEEDELRAAIGAVAKLLADSISELDTLQHRLYQLE